MQCSCGGSVKRETYGFKCTACGKVEKVKMNEDLKQEYSAATTEEERIAVVRKHATLQGKSERSIIAQLSKAGIYVPISKKSKITGDKPATKEAMVAEIASLLGLDQLEGLEKASKLSLVSLLDALKAQ